MDKCEICGATENLITVSVQPVTYKNCVLSSLLCDSCNKKYRTPYLRFLYNGTVAQNLVREYNDRIKDGFSWIKG